MKIEVGAEWAIAIHFINFGAMPIKIKYVFLFNVYQDALYCVAREMGKYFS